MARATTKRSSRGFFTDLLTLDRAMTGPSTHLIYWGGLAVIALVSFGVVGGAVGVLLRGGSVQTLLLSLPLMVGGLVLCGVLALLWRGVCEFYLAVFRIADNLSALRVMIERETLEAAAPPAPSARPTLAPIVAPIVASAPQPAPESEAAPEAKTVEG